ncbi:MAG: hypothetical protein ACFFAO_05330 [Candidatus Hermodarchaeota archaeon]
MSNDNISAFIASWDKDVGIKIIDSFPKTLIVEYDRDFIALKIFTAFHNFYQNGEEINQIKRTIFKLPMNNINRRALIFIDTIRIDNNRTNPYIIVILFPDYLIDKELDEYKNLIYEIGIEYFEKKELIFQKNCRYILEQFKKKEKVKDAEISLEPTYNEENALLDFKEGLELFAKKQYEQAYYFLKKANLEFEQINNLDLRIKSSFYLSSTLLQLNKYDAAQNLLKILERISYESNSIEYYEKALYMEGICAYKNENYKKSLKYFKKLETTDLQYIDKYNFYYLYGRVLRLSNSYSNAILSFENALKISSQQTIQNKKEQSNARLLIELGHTKYSEAIKLATEEKLENSISFKSYLRETIEYYRKSTKIMKKSDNFSGLIIVFQLIGNIQELLGNYIYSNDNYRKAMQYTEISNDVPNRLKIFNLIIQNLAKLNQYEKIVEEVDQMLAKIISYAFVDLFTIGKYHRQLGEAFFMLEKNKEALSEFLISLNVYNKLDVLPISEILVSLKFIIGIYKVFDDNETDKYVNYYTGQYNQFQERLKKNNLKKFDESEIFDVIKEFWLFTNDGNPLFSYNPETSVDPQLFGGFLLALQHFSIELASKKINSISIGLDQYVFYREFPSFYILGRSKIQKSLNLIETILKKIYNLFWNTYNSKLDEYDGNNSRFSNFLEIIKKNKSEKK